MADRPSFNLPVVPARRPSGVVRCDEPAEPHADEFARGASAWDERFSRRNFLTLAGAGLALAGVTGCTDRPDEPIVPYVEAPEQVVAGEPNFFATTITRGGYGRGVIVTSREGRPVKIEGNPDHPASLGAADALTQADVLGLYDPLRSKAVTHAGVPKTWGAFVTALQNRLATHAADGGAGLILLTDAITSPTVISQIDELRRRFPNAQCVSYEPLSRANVYAGVSRVAGGPGDVAYDLTDADVVVGFGGDFMIDEPGSLAYARQFAARRRPTANSPAMSRLYVAESDFSATGTRADHRLAARPSRVGELLDALCVQVGAVTGAMPANLTAAEAAWLSAVATDLAAHRGRCVVIAGPLESPAVQAASLTLNHSLGNTGKTVKLIEPVVQAAASGAPPLAVVRDAIAGGSLRTLLVVADNPVRTAGRTADLRGLAEFSRRPDTFTAHLGLYENETSFDCQWHVPAKHELEQWGDARAYDGTASIVQPLIGPMTGGKSVIDVLNVLLGRENVSAYDTVRGHWQKHATPDDGATFDAWWDAALRRGTIKNTTAAALPFKTPTETLDSAPRASGSMEVVFRPDPSVYDGRHFHNPWLQELPRPMTKIVWGNAALLSPKTADKLGLENGDVVRLSVGEKNDAAAEIPILRLTGVAEDTAVLHLGYGRHRVTNGDEAWSESNLPFGVDVYPLRSAASPLYATDVSVTKAGRHERIVRTHGHHDLAADKNTDPSVRKSLTPQVIATPESSAADLKLHNRKLIRTATLEAFKAEPAFAQKMDEGDIKQLYPTWNYDTGPQWGMTIDLNTCIGCNACVIACQAENNIPTVGPDQVAAEREMQWLRIDQYVGENEAVHNQPVPCMHCENAPCEYVCPVAATTHSVDGLNQMTYNRCVGTRYCSNNCPYKVRRFNFLNYTFYKPEQYKNQANPDVTVRTRGVMEKCSYCVQRLVYADRKTEIATVNAGDGDPAATAAMRDEMFGRVQTACQQTCPTQAIVFGDLINADSAVAASKKSPLNYGILTELSTKPRTTYLAAVTNPSPMMAGGKDNA